jgi:PAS domain S-box-containing protein
MKSRLFRVLPGDSIMRDNSSEERVPEILIVDDMPENVQMTSLLLKEKGYKARPALSGKLALQAVQDILPDLILLDIDMPEMDGYEVCKRLKIDGKTKEIPVIFISSLSDELDKVSAFQLGGVDYVEKPVRSEELFARIETHLRIRKLQLEVSCHNQHLETLVHERTNQLSSAYRELEQAHKELQENERIYRRITEEITDYVYTVTVRDGRALETKHGMACEAITGYNVQHFTAEPLLWINMVPLEERDRIVEHVKNILAGKELPAIEHRIIRKDGHIRWVRDKSVLHFDSHNVLVSYEGVISDITERKQAEEELKKSREFDRALFDHNPIETIVVDCSGRVVGFNLMKRNSGDKLPKLGDIMYKDYAGKHKCDMHAELMKCIRTGKKETFPDLKYGYKFLSVTIAPFPEGAIITAIDITERKKAEEKLIRAKEELELAHNKLLEASQSERLALTGRIAANIAHEIRNPSTSVSLALAQLSGTLKPKERQVKYLEIIERNINRINYLIDEMLNCARPPELNLKPHDIHEILKLAIESAELKMAVKKIKLVKKFTSADSTLNVDKEQIGRVFLNIIINAIDAMSKKGDILTIGTENNGESFQIKIKDTGKGIPEGDIIKIFDPFFTSKPSGIGLGLATCYSVVVSHGGTIEVSSEVSKGTTFTVTLPRI